jgi:hypothetical protein
MANDILDPDFWTKRYLRGVQQFNQPHRAVFECTLDLWEQICKSHRRILSKYVGRRDAILDVGCGWGRILDLLPKSWKGPYLGVDLCPEFIKMARRKYPDRCFVVGDLRNLDIPTPNNKPFPMYDIAILVSIRPMMKRELGEETWQQMETNVRKYATRLLYLEYDPEDLGAIE